MLRKTTTVALILLAVPLAGCSLVIDVPADCTDADCQPYVCDEDGIECLDFCTSDAECSNGFLCNGESLRCEPTGCEPVFDAVELDGLPESISEFNVAVGGSPEQVMVVIGRPDGLGFRRFNANGSVVNDPPDPDLGLVRLAAPNHDRLAFDPVARYLDETESAAAGGSPRFVVGWRVAQENRNLLHVGTFVVKPPSAPTVRSSHEAGTRTEIRSASFAPNGNGLLTAWRSVSGENAVIHAQETDIAGMPVVEDDPIVVSDEERVAGKVSISRIGGLQYAVYSMSGDGDRTIRAQALDASGDVLGHVELLADRSATGFDILSLDAVSAGDTGAAVWTERTGSQTSVWAGLLDDALARAIDPGLVVSVPPLRLDTDFQDIDTVRVSSGESTFSAAWFGTRAGRYDLWLSRYAGDGTPLFVPLAVAGDAASTIEDFRVVSTSNGVGVLWLDEGESGGRDRLYYRRYECAR